MDKWFRTLFICLIAVVSSCSSKKEIRVGVDAEWYPQDFGENQAFVNGFVEELLLEISRDSGVEFYRIGANWDMLLEGLQRHRYEVVISSTQNYNFNQAKYQFSPNFLDIGPVLVAHADSTAQKLDDMANHVVGILGGEQELLVIQKYPEVLTRTYDSASEAFEALIRRDVDGIIVDRLHAVNYIRGAYSQDLKMIGAPLNSLGLHFMTLKDGSLDVFNQSLKHLKKKKKLQKLQKKWNLGT